MAWVIQNGCGREPLPVSFMEQDQQPGLSGTRTDTFREMGHFFRVCHPSSEKGSVGSELVGWGLGVSLESL